MKILMNYFGKKVIVFLGLFILCFASRANDAPEWLEAMRPTKNYIRLSGEWEYADCGERPYFALPLPENAWKKAEVPCQREDLPQCAYRWWRRSFEIPSKMAEKFEKGGKAILYLEGRAFKWRLILNGKTVFDSLDAFNPFQLDVTEYLNLKGENTLVIGTSDLAGICLNYKKKKAIMPRGNPELPQCLLWGEVELWSRPEKRIENVFVKPSWRKKLLEVDVEVRASETNFNLKGKVIDQGGKIVLNISSSNILRQQSDEGAFHFSFNQEWTNPIPWNVDNPHLYKLRLELVDKSGRIYDIQDTEFGFREIWIEGGNIMMNGRRVFFARKSVWPHLATAEQSKKKAEYHAKCPGINSLRIRCDSFYSLNSIAWHADREGLMLIPQHLFNPHGYDIYNNLLWSNYKKFINRWLRSAWNHPSIMIWGLSNEVLKCCYLGGDKDYVSKQLLETEKLANKIDPTRPVTFDGDWDLPPSHKAETVNLHYPFKPSKHRYPTECWDFLDPKKPFKIDGLSGEYVWFGKKIKPIIVGEFIWMWNKSNHPWCDTMYGGDSVFDWTFWKSREVFNQNLRWMTDAWRVSRFAGVNPWSHSSKHFKKLMPLETVVLRDQFKTFFSGEALSLKAWVLNDSQTDNRYLVKWRISDKKSCFYKGEKAFSIQAGGIAPFEMGLKIPQVKSIRDLELTIEITRSGEIRFQESYPIRIHPRIQTQWTFEGVLYDPGKETEQVLRKIGVKAKTIDSIMELEKVKALLLGRNALSELSDEDIKQLSDFVSKGGNLLCLDQKNSDWVKLGFALPGIRILENSKSNFVWNRATGHPILNGIKDMDLRLWRSGDWVCERAIEKPQMMNGVPWSCLIDVGYYNGLKGCALIQAFHGKGRILLCTLNMKKAETDPGARTILVNLLKDLERRASPRHKLAIQSKENSQLNTLLKKMKVSLTDLNDSNAKIFFIDARSQNIPYAQIAQKVLKGAHAFIYGLEEDNIEKWKNVDSGISGLKDCSQENGFLINHQNPSSLIWGLSNEEFFWYGGAWTEALRHFRVQNKGIHGVYPLTKVADCEILFDKGEALISPAVLVEVKKGKGGFIFSTINFDEGLLHMPSATYRIIQNLLCNLDVKFEPLKGAQGVKHSFVDLREYVNRGFQDEIANDGKGGWSDQGPEYDLRFFPVNLTGFNSVGEPETPPEKFPDILISEGIPFKIIDPRSNKGKSMILLEPRQKLLPKGIVHDCLKSVRIPVGRDFERMYCLHTAAWTIPGETLWSYILHYADDSSETLPVRSSNEVNDWHKSKPSRRAHIAWRGETIKFKDIAIYICPFENPHPDKKVESIEIVSECKSYGGVFSITLEE